ncbi:MULTISPECIES: hypothetical protein [unclassified Mesorhizobium]|uniref:hypothetical protein n=1 Tax=unclassified Mesorhizobium TaxID=325217 RepID=UPI000FD3060D|nr:MULTISPECIES: hypothetical protein [unclassified Mesorhizobium]RUV93578.1 hypothetical protein EOA88_06930 [Mesorhizobium sp. M5C.F.Ca.IN.020.14.1.1]RUV28372.1 hypothetical protein EOA86_20125 [Mesorhizobium sp. M5C.F.Ca.IN.020.32.2.1]RWG50729.1 MAG: hypothetical protein EOQ62_03450 [Mesorhizobium sp.]RWH55700.1 MAG: hypothetical protein EOQ82_15065 [Mesorhizobium sp.]RWI70710.1 MAG: hypothetical protein EOR18_18335 [Mesorhizobium sp.]
MSHDNIRRNASAAAERFFRLYHAHCVAPDRDTLFSLLEAAHSLNDRLQIREGFDFFDLQEFSALKCLRNFFHHHQELRHVVRLIPVGNYPVVTDLMILCLIPRDIVDSAVNETRGRHKEEARRACEAVFHWYGSVVNINPALFNFVVSAYERIKEADISVTGDAFREFESSYAFEEDHGHAHRVDGRLGTRAGDVGQLLADIMNTNGL